MGNLFSGRQYEQLPNGRWKWTCWDRGQKIAQGTADTREQCDGKINSAFSDFHDG